MVKSIKAFQAEDGTIFADVEAAARHDAKTQLKKLFSNEAFVNEVLQHHSKIFDLLAPLNIGVNMMSDREIAERYPSNA